MKQQKKESKAKRTAQEFIGIVELTDSGVMTEQGELVLYKIRPINVAVLPPATIEAKVAALSNVLKNTSGVDILCLNSAESFDDNKLYLNERLRQEDNPIIKRLCEQDIAFLDDIQTEMATAREFYLVRRFRIERGGNSNSEKQKTEKILKEQGFEAKIASRNEIKRLLAVYYTQNVFAEQYDEIDGERYVGDFV